MRRPSRRDVLRLTIAVAALTATRLLARDAASDVIGSVEYSTIAPEDTLADLAIRYDYGYCELVAANRGLDPWLPATGSTIVLPGQHILPLAARSGLVINIGDMRLYRFGADGTVDSYPIGIASDNDAIVLGRTSVMRKRENPVWIPPASIRAERPELPALVAPGPDNPLGSFALDLGWPAMVIHGTNRPYGVGRRVSHGCFRLAEKNIAALFALTLPGTPVTVTYEPVKLGWLENALMLQIHPDANQMSELDERGDFTPDYPVELPGALRGVLSNEMRERIDWSMVADAAWRRTGVPVRIDHPPVIRPPRD